MENPARNERHATQHDSKKQSAEFLDYGLAQSGSPVKTWV